MNQNTKNILLLSLSNLKTDPRVYRQICFLKANSEYNLITAGLQSPDLENVKFYKINPTKHSFIATKAFKAVLLKQRKFYQYYWSTFYIQNIFERLTKLKIDLIIANDIKTLPLAVKLANNCQAKLLLDAHEYEPRHFDDRWRFRFFFQDYWDYICRKYLPYVDAMTTVCQGIAEEYQKNHGVQCEILTNAPFYQKIQSSSINSQKIRMIYHGIVNPSRKTENMIKLVDLLDERFYLDFMLVPNQTKYIKKLKRMSSNNSRIKFREPVPMLDIAKTINEYDIGLFLLSPVAFNYKMALPNKLFEFIQARLAVAIWPSQEMARVVHKADCGVVADDFTVEAMAKMLNSLSTEDIKQFKQNSHKAASVYCAENNRQILFNSVEKLIG